MTRHDDARSLLRAAVYNTEVHINPDIEAKTLTIRPPSAGKTTLRTKPFRHLCDELNCTETVLSRHRTALDLRIGVIVNSLRSGGPGFNVLGQKLAQPVRQRPVDAGRPKVKRRGPKRVGQPIGDIALEKKRCRSMGPIREHTSRAGGVHAAAVLDEGPRSSTKIGQLKRLPEGALLVPA